MDLLISERIKKYRKDKEMTQDALAQALSVSPQSVSKWECGDGYPDITLLPAIANFFEVTIDELIGNDEISAKEDVQKNFFNVINTLSPNDQLELAIQYNKKYPRNWHIATSLMHRITRYRGNNEDEYRKLLVNIGERILKDCTDSTMRRSAVTAMCMVCDEEEIQSWLNRDTTFWYEGRPEIYEKRYKLSGEEEKYWMIRNAGNFLRTSAMIGRMREHKSYIGKPEDSVEWNTMYLNILTGITQNSIPDGWIPEYTMQYIRLSAAYFGLGDKESGYSHLEKALELCKRWQEFPENALLDLGNPLFFGETKLIKNDWLIQLPNGEKLPLLQGFKNSIANLASIMQAEKGWEWFNSVRTEERWSAILSEAKSLTIL
ncbi:MAG: helix-turn-helix transcriptional regulator [Ruminococcaceae bacterium]|nr:helix-turn-helix transcriptional regulator [Oscillospiraceae bacterium]